MKPYLRRSNSHVIFSQTARNQTTTSFNPLFSEIRIGLWNPMGEGFKREGEMENWEKERILQREVLFCEVFFK